MKKVMLTKTKEAAAKMNGTTTATTSTLLEATQATTPIITPPMVPVKRHCQLQLQQQQGVCMIFNGAPKSPEVYEQRRAMKPAYKELFNALFKIPDKQVQHRVLDALNGIAFNNIGGSSGCPECQQRVLKNLKREFKDNATQTETSDAIGGVNNSKNNSICGSLSEESRDTPPILSEGDKNMNDTNNSDEKPPTRRKRKRKNCLPRVIKHSHAQHVQMDQQPQLRKRINGPEPVARCEETNSSTASADTNIDNTAVKRQRCDSITSTIINEVDSDNSLSGLCELLESRPKQVEPTKDIIYTTMAKEFLVYETYVDGYLPIHFAIIDNDYNRLKRQIYVWNKMKNMKEKDLNEILTEDDEDCLQVAINHNSLPHTIEIILEAGFDVNFIYEASNTALHLAILHEIDISSIICIAKRIDLCLLLKTNDNGYTPLYLAVRENRYFYAEAILNVVDERLKLKPCTRKENVKKLQESEEEEKAFAQFYTKQCEKMHLNIAEQLAQKKSEDFKRKQYILNVNDPKSGSTMLFYAIEQRMEHFIYFLLAHLADPLVENLSGQDAKSFFGEYGRSLKLNVKIDKFLENVVSVLH